MQQIQGHSNIKLFISVFEKNRPPSDKPTTSADAEPSTSKKKKSEMKGVLFTVPNHHLFHVLSDECSS